jgi:hypothetical protein
MRALVDRTARRFRRRGPSRKQAACFVVRDGNGQQLANVYFDDHPRKMVACRWQSC